MQAELPQGGDDTEGEAHNVQAQPAPVVDVDAEGLGDARVAGGNNVLAQLASVVDVDAEGLGDARVAGENDLLAESASAVPRMESQMFLPHERSQGQKEELVPLLGAFLAI